MGMEKEKECSGQSWKLIVSLAFFPAPVVRETRKAIQSKAHAPTVRRISLDEGVCYILFPTCTQASSDPNLWVILPFSAASLPQST